MLYVVRYSALFDCGRHPGGPPPPEYQPIFANAGTLETAIFDSTIECVLAFVAQLEQVGADVRGYKSVNCRSRG